MKIRVLQDGSSVHFSRLNCHSGLYGKFDVAFREELVG
jgi:hypothetical protein